MSTGKFDSGAFAAVACAVILLFLAGAMSIYASGQSSRSMARLVDETVRPASKNSAWTTIREGCVLGRSLSPKGPASYVIVARRAGGDYRAVASVDDDGSILGVFPLGDATGYAPTKRLGALFGRAGKSGNAADTSPLDASLQPLIVDTLETITRLERTRTEALDADR